MISRRQWLAGSLAPVVSLAQTAAGAGRRVAITLDDGPVVGEGRDLTRFQSVTAGLIEALAAEKVPATVFINERQLHVPGERDARVAVLSRWLEAGFELGNHTYSHPDLNRTPLWQYQDDIIRGEVVMRALLAERSGALQWFRHPFLHTGATLEIRRALDSFVAERRYRIAPVTVDYADYAFNGVYNRLLRAGDQSLAEKVRQAYEEQVDIGFHHFEKFSGEVLGYELPQILLIHCNALNAVSLPATIARLRARGYSFVSLAEAMTDPAYQRPDDYVGPGGLSWLRRWAMAMGKPRPPEDGPRLPQWITDLPRPGR